MRWNRSHRIAFVAASLFGCAPCFGQAATYQAQRSVDDIASHVAEGSQRFGMPQALIYAVMRAESAGRIGAVSPAGAMGLMQLMPATWARQRARFALGSDPFDPRDNIMAGVSYLRELYDRYGASGFLAAYNAGPGRYEAWRDHGRPLPAETRVYVSRIASLLQPGGNRALTAAAQVVQPVRLSWAQSRLFVSRATGTGNPSGDFAPASSPQALASPDSRPDGLFVPVSGSRSQ